MDVFFCWLKTSQVEASFFTFKDFKTTRGSVLLGVIGFTKRGYIRLVENLIKRKTKARGTFYCRRHQAVLCWIWNLSQCLIGAL